MHRTALSTAAIGLALAACAFELTPTAGQQVTRLQVLPAGEFKPNDSRELPVAAWHIDAASAQRVIERLRQRKTPAVIDYEHQTLHKEANGQAAPAAGWFKDLEWREGEGLFGTVELTARGRQQVADGEYRYFSPVFTFDVNTGEVLELLMGAFTNTPAIDGMAAMQLQAAASRSLFSQPHEEPPMNKLLAAVAVALALPAAATEDQAVTALNAVGPIKPLTESLAGLRTALGLDDKADAQAIVAACTALKAKAEAKPDPAQYVPIAALTQVQGELAALSSKVNGAELDQVIEGALADGRLIAGEQEKWARELGKKDLAALNAFLKTAQPIAALGSTQTKGKAPAGRDPNAALGEDELAVCSRMGLTPEQFKAGAVAA